MSDGAALDDLAHYIRENHRGIITQFAVLVRLDPEIKISDNLPTIHVVNFLNRILTALVETLILPENAKRLRNVGIYARAHARHRWQQGYRIDEVLREFAILRQVLLFHAGEFQSQAKSGGDAQSTANRRLNNFVDQVLNIAIYEFSTTIASTGRMTRTAAAPVSDPSSKAKTAKHLARSEA